MFWLNVLASIIGIGIVSVGVIGPLKSHYFFREYGK
jgi:hypothetical protein